MTHFFDWLIKKQKRNEIGMYCCVCVSRSETDDYRQTPQVDQDVAAPVPSPDQPIYEDVAVAAQPAYGSRITQRLPEGTHSGFIKRIFP